MDPCGLFLLGVSVLILVFKGIPALLECMEQAQAERARKEAEEADARFQREHPEAWRAKEMVKLERERLEAEKTHALQRQQQDNTRQNAGAIVAAGRFLGWW